MLILTRRVGETLMIGDEVTVTVLGVKGNQVRIGVNAPKDVAVHREEIYERIKNEENGNDAADIFLKVPATLFQFPLYLILPQRYATPLQAAVRRICGAAHN